MHLIKNGFTILEILMVLLLVGILAAVAVTQLTNYTAEARTSTIKANLQEMRQAIARQTTKMRSHCGLAAGSFPPLATILKNDTTAGEAHPCTPEQVPEAADRRFFASRIPGNSWGPGQSNTIAGCVGAGCTDRATYNCLGEPRNRADGGWCYNVSNGDLWANSARNDEAGSTTGTEYSY